MYVCFECWSVEMNFDRAIFFLSACLDLCWMSKDSLSVEINSWKIQDHQNNWDKHKKKKACLIFIDASQYLNQRSIGNFVRLLVT